VLERRIRGGDYLVAPLPGERELAAELGVSYMTARKAVLLMQQRGLLARGPTGRLILAGQGSAARMAQVAFLAPAHVSADVMRWSRALHLAATARGCAVKAHFFAHWDDPALLDILDRGDGAFLYPSSAPLSPTIERRIRGPARRLVVVDQDWSHLGLPSLCLSLPTFVQDILGHLAAGGHRRIACLNTQPHDAAILARLAQYSLWASQHGMPVELIDEPVAPGEDPLTRARHVIARRLAAGPLGFTALFVTTASAIGAMRACHDAGLSIGRDLAVATLNDDGLADLTIPSLTTQRTPDPEPFLRRALDWILAPKHRPWPGSLLLRPEVCEIAARESTVQTSG